jgi:hypothetical protein
MVVGMVDAHAAERDIHGQLSAVAQTIRHAPEE